MEEPVGTHSAATAVAPRETPRPQGLVRREWGGSLGGSDRHRDMARSWGQRGDVAQASHRFSDDRGFLRKPL